MSTLDETPTFNLKAVVQETGIKPDTLRAWERRYGLPQPARTSGGHRLYSQRDIDTLKWLIERQDEGLSISRAVDLWNQIVGEGKEPFLEMAEEEEPVGPVPLEVGDTLAELRESWVEACLAFDEQRAEYTLAQTFALYPAETGCLEVLQKGLAEIGQRWYLGEVTAQQEHFASALAMRRLESLVAINPRPTRPGRILIGCPPEEEHTFSPLLLTLLLRRRGWEVLYLGADVPLNRLEMTIERTDPDLVILTSQTLITAATLLQMSGTVLEAGIPLAFGGRIFNVIPNLKERMPGHFLGTTLSQAPQVVEQLLNMPVVVPDAAESRPEHAAALANFRQRRARLEAYIWEKAHKMNIPQEHLARANRNLGEGIIAALILGDMDFLGHDLAWVEGLIDNFHYQMPPHVLRYYISVYHAAAAEHLGEEGELTISWLDRLNQNVNGEGFQAQLLQEKE